MTHGEIRNTIHVPPKSQTTIRYLRRDGVEMVEQVTTYEYGIRVGGKLPFVRRDPDEGS